MKRSAYVVILVVMVAILSLSLCTVASADQQSGLLGCWTIMGEGYCNAYHNYYAYSSIEWMNTNMTANVFGNSRPNNYLEIKLYDNYSGTVLKWSLPRTRITGNSGFHTYNVYQLTHKGKTNSWWKLTVDVPNWPDPSDEGYIPSNYTYF
jgi:hypothetical protein